MRRAVAPNCPTTSHLTGRRVRAASSRANHPGNPLSWVSTPQPAAVDSPTTAMRTGGRDASPMVPLVGPAAGEASLIVERIHLPCTAAMGTRSGFTRSSSRQLEGQSGSMRRTSSSGRPGSWTLASRPWRAAWSVTAWRWWSGRPGHRGRGGVATLAPGPCAGRRSGRGGGWPGAAGRPGDEARRASLWRARQPARSCPCRLRCGRRIWPARYGPAAGRASPEGAHPRGRSPPALACTNVLSAWRPTTGAW